MNGFGLIQLVVASAIFIAAATVAKAWALAPSLGKIVLTMALYTAGNLLMLRLIRLMGMATAFSVSAVLQLVAVNLVAFLFYGERLGTIQGIGIVLALLAVVLVSFGPRWSS